MATSEELRDRFRELRTSLKALPEVSEPPKSMLRILGSARSEQRWNTLLAYFLDPSQPHGFNADLLKAFLDVAQSKSDAEIEYYHRDIETIQVDTEATSPQNNRPDIVIRVPGEWFVCIESKVEATEGERQTERYTEDSHINNDEKSEYSKDGHHYLFLSKRFAPDSRASGFSDLYWDQVVDAFHEELRRSHGKYPERSVNQFEDFLSTITQVTSMEDDDFTTIQKEKVQLLSEYRNDIDDLLEATNSLRERAIEDWPELFRSQVDGELWTDEWNTRPDHGEFGVLFRDGWYLDNEELEPTLDYKATQGNTGFRLHFVHLIRRKESFTRGKLIYILRSPTNVELRDEFNELYTSDRWQNELEPILDERDITNKGNLRDYTHKEYEVDQSGLPESYFETLAVAFEEHLPVARGADEILDEALRNVTND
jgi:hypothetical protein